MVPMPCANESGSLCRRFFRLLMLARHKQEATLDLPLTHSDHELILVPSRSSPSPMHLADNPIMGTTGDPCLDEVPLRSFSV